MERFLRQDPNNEKHPLRPHLQSGLNLISSSSTSDDDDSGDDDEQDPTLPPSAIRQAYF